MNDQDQKELFDFVSDFAKKVKYLDFSSFKKSDGVIEYSRINASGKHKTIKMDDGLQASKRQLFKQDNNRRTIEVIENLHTICRIGHDSNRVQVNFDITKYDSDTITFLLLWAFNRECSNSDRISHAYDSIADEKALQLMIKYNPTFKKEIVLKEFLEIVTLDTNWNRTRKEDMAKMLQQK